MFAENLTWQAWVFLLLVFAGMGAVVAMLAAKAFKSWKDALK